MTDRFLFPADEAGQAPDDPGPDGDGDVGADRGFEEKPLFLPVFRDVADAVALQAVGDAADAGLGPADVDRPAVQAVLADQDAGQLRPAGPDQAVEARGFRLRGR